MSDTPAAIGALQTRGSDQLGKRAPSVSIAIATYNGAAHIRKQLNSFASQTRLPDEVVIFDDGSSDETVSLVTDYARKVPFAVSVERNEVNLGYNRNFEKAISACSGDYIFISDQDDEWFPEKISLCLDSLISSGAHAVVNDQLIVEGDGQETGVSVLGNVRKLGFTDWDFGPGCCTVVTRQILPVLLPFPKDVAYDFWINVLPAALDSRVVLDRPLQSYRRHGSNTTDAVFARAKAGAVAQSLDALRGDARSAFKAKVASLDLALQRLEERSEQIASLGIDRSKWKIDYLRRERSAYASRLSCLEKGRLRRVGPIATMLLDGTYGRFRGIKTAIKDLVT